jgi:hypothetical protein
MISRMRVFLMLGVALFVLATLAIFGTTGIKPTEAQSMSIYQELQEAAAKGNEWARSFLTQVDALLMRQGKLLPPQERQIGAVDTVNGISVWVRGQDPFFLKIYNRQEFTDLSELETYLENRRATGAQLVSENADRQIEVSVSFEEYTDVSQVWQLKDAYGLDIDQMTANLFLHGEWHSVMFVGDPKDPGEQPIIDFTEPAEIVEAQLRQLVPPEPFAERIPGPSELEFKVGWLRGKMRAADAMKLDSTPSIMLVDPISDLLDAYVGRAVDIEVVDVPHLLAIKSRLEGTTDSSSGPAGVQPTPTPIRR